MGQTVVRTPEFSQARILRPFSGFESKYTGLDPSVYPIALPGNLDARAGKEGYDPNFIAGMPVPMGARCKLWLPRLTSPLNYGSGNDNLTYRYLLVWRVRNIQEAATDPTQELAAHFGRNLPGVSQVESPIASINSGGSRIAVPASITTVQLPNRDVAVGADRATATQARKGEQDYPDFTPAADETFYGANDARWPEPITTNIASEQFRVFPGNDWPAPLSPSYTGQNSQNGDGSIVGAAKLGHAGILSQGYYADGNGTGNPAGDDGSTFKNGTGSRQAASKAGPIYDIVNVEAEGDELLLLITRPLEVPVASGDSGWDFQDTDLPLASVFGANTPSTLGVYLFTGSSAGG